MTKCPNCGAVANPVRQFICGTKRPYVCSKCHARSEFVIPRYAPLLGGATGLTMWICFERLLHYGVEAFIALFVAFLLSACANYGLFWALGRLRPQVEVSNQNAPVAAQ